MSTNHSMFVYVDEFGKEPKIKPLSKELKDLGY